MNERYNFEIKEVTAGELASVAGWFAREYYEGDSSAADMHFGDHFDGGTTLLGRTEGKIAGFITIRWVSGNVEFRKNNVPLIHHLEVFNPYKRHGLGNRLVEAAEHRISRVADTAGICVGIFDAYGPAQRLYVKRGYVPDGRGVCKSQVPIRQGEVHPIDHDLIIWLTKDLRKGTQ
jgi:GNAT superfamily N-acetyltransferase